MRSRTKLLLKLSKQRQLSDNIADSAENVCLPSIPSDPQNPSGKKDPEDNEGTIFDSDVNKKTCKGRKAEHTSFFYPYF